MMNEPATVYSLSRTLPAENSKQEGPHEDVRHVMTRRKGKDENAGCSGVVISKLYYVKLYDIPIVLRYTYDSWGYDKMEAS